MIIEAKNLRMKENLKSLENFPGYYKFWAEKEELQIILDELETNFDEVKDFIESRDNCYAIYVGIAAKEPLKKRLNWHINDSHTTSRVVYGTLSTLRQSISSIVAHNQCDKKKTDIFIDKLKIELFFYRNGNLQNIESELREIERKILSTNLYILNIQGNKHPFANTITKKLKELRKLAKENINVNLA